MNAMELHRLFFSKLLTIGVAKILDWGGIPQITWNDFIKTFERGTFCETKMS